MKKTWCLKNQTEETECNEGVNVQTTHNPSRTNAPFVFMLSSCHQLSLCKYFAAVFIGVFRTLPNIENGAFCENSYEKKLFLLETCNFLMISGDRGVQR